MAVASGYHDVVMVGGVEKMTDVDGAGVDEGFVDGGGGGGPGGFAFGGGSGMVMKPEPLAGAIRAATRTVPEAKTVLLTPQGRPFHQNMAKELASFDGLVLICGRYEGVDDRICHDLIDYEISIGDYVLTGGELAAMAPATEL